MLVPSRTTTPISSVTSPSVPVEFEFSSERVLILEIEITRGKLGIYGREKLIGRGENGADFCTGEAWYMKSIYCSCVAIYCKEVRICNEQVTKIF